ncbi:MAG: M20 family metallopeptidase [Promethearchaeota archaeon]|jgi:succinyl-diaminopimelate desuccinylase
MSNIITEKKIIPQRPLTDDEKDLLALVDENEELVVNLLQQMVQIESLNLSEFVFSERNEIFKFVETFMSDAGFRTKLFKSPFLSGKEDEFYYNLIASYEGDSSERFLQFNGHLDIVPYNPDTWDEDTPPLSGVIKEGKLFGRGSVDMKAGVACQMIAMKLLKNSGKKIKGKLQMWFTPDEETHGAYGTKFMTRNHLEVIKADATIVSEPSIIRPLQSPYIGIAEKGPHWFKFTFHGAAGHGSWPKEKSSALNKAVRFMSQATRKLKIPKYPAPITKKKNRKMLKKRVNLNEYKKEQAKIVSKNPYDKDKRSSDNLYKTTFSFNMINAGVKTNVIPDTCNLEVDFRTIPGLKTQELIDAIVKYCSKLKYKIELPDGYRDLQHSKSKFKEEPVDISLSLITIGEGSSIDPNSGFGVLLQHAFEAVYEVKSIFSFGTGFTDAGNMREVGLENTFVLGPGGRNAHGSNEYVEIDTLKDITKLYLLVAYRYLSD